MDFQQLVPQIFKSHRPTRNPTDLIPFKGDLPPYYLGMPQKSGSLTVIPVFSTSDTTDKFTAPLTGLKLSQVRGYGNMELANSGEGIAIAPLHMGYIQDKAQNHALCRSAFIASGQKLMFEDACCVQAAQGGYLQEKEQWFFILPLQLRQKALELQGIPGYSKLWEAIADLNRQFNLPNRGHLEQIISRERAYLTQYQSRFELIANQIGALFLINEKLAGIEIAPSPAYFAELWMPLVCFCYGVGAMQAEMGTKAKSNEIVPFPARNLQELRQQLAQSRSDWQAEVSKHLAKVPPELFEVTKEEKFLNMKLQTLNSNNFAGQVVSDGQQLVYASVFAMPAYING